MFTNSQPAGHAYNYNTITVDLRGNGYAYTAESRNHREMFREYRGNWQNSTTTSERQHSMAFA
jgi:hypothetical protein